MAELKQIYPQYQDAGILVMLDSDSILQQRKLLAEGLPYIDGIKVDVQALSVADQQSIQQWQQHLEDHHKRLILKNIETLADYELAQMLNVRYGQGYFFGRPVMPRMI
jgi:c-di-GMP-related signal transduction protein